MLKQVELQTEQGGGLGAVRLAGYIRDSRGDDQGTGRRLGRYALVYSIKGSCDYWDEVNGARTVGPGELFFLFPEITHRYGATDGSGWDEFYVVFEGPVFDLWRQCGLLDPGHSFLRLEPVAYWSQRLQSCIEVPGVEGADAALARVIQLQTVLLEALRAGKTGTRQAPMWLDAARVALADVQHAVVKLDTLARQLGVSFESFRKGFRAATGKSPARYRSEKQVEAAAQLLASSCLSSKEIAQRLGFADECHFSKRFKQLTGVAPRDFRRRVCGHADKANAAVAHASGPRAT